MAAKYFAMWFWWSKWVTSMKSKFTVRKKFTWTVDMSGDRKSSSLCCCCSDWMLRISSSARNILLALIGCEQEPFIDSYFTYLLTYLLSHSLTHSLTRDRVLDVTLLFQATRPSLLRALCRETFIGTLTTCWSTHKIYRKKIKKIKHLEVRCTLNNASNIEIK